MEHIISSVIDTLLDRAEAELRSAKACPGQGDPNWIVHMTTSKICTAMADAVISARKGAHLQ